MANFGMNPSYSNIKPLSGKTYDNAKISPVDNYTDGWWFFENGKWVRVG